MKALLIAVLLISSAALTHAQKVVVVTGSSTAVGTGANPYDSAWVGRLQLYFRRNTTPGDPDTVVYNIAQGATTTYDLMPTGYVPPNGRPAPVQSMNITRALSFNPDVIIINSPTNDVANTYTKKETMDNFRTIFQTMQNAGKRGFITTSQPRNLTPDLRDSLRTLVDSIKNNFGAFAIDFYTDIVNTDGSLTIDPSVNSDGTHVNNLGHRYLFQRAIAANLFPSGVLPVKLVSFGARLNANRIVLNWKTADEEDNTSFEIQRSADGRNFQPVANISGTGKAEANYEWVDNSPLSKVFYRLKVTESGRIFYSGIASLSLRASLLQMEIVKTDPSQLSLSLSAAGKTSADIRVLTLSGVVVSKNSVTIDAGRQEYSVNIASLAQGTYIVSVTTATGGSETRRFVKVN